MFLMNVLPTNQLTDRPTDTAYYRNARTHLKTQSDIIPVTDPQSDSSGVAFAISSSFTLPVSRNGTVMYVKGHTCTRSIEVKTKLVLSSHTSLASAAVGTRKELAS